MAEEETRQKEENRRTDKRRRSSEEKDDGEHQRSSKGEKAESGGEVETPSPIFSSYEEEEQETITAESQSSNFDSAENRTENKKDISINVSSDKSRFQDYEEKGQNQIEKTRASSPFEEEEEGESSENLQLTSKDSDFEDVENEIGIEKRRNKSLEDMESELSSIKTLSREESQKSEQEEMLVEDKEITTEEEQKEENEDMSVDAAEAGTGGGGTGEEIPEFPDLVYNIPRGKGALRSSDPKLILFRDSDEDPKIGSFETLCKRIYREQKGGTPKAKIISQADELNEKEIKKIVEAEGKGENRIFRIDVDPEKIDLDDEDFKDRLEELYSQELGFIILRTTSNQKEKKYWGLLKSLMERKHLPQILVVGSKLLDLESKQSIAELSWGFLPVESTSGFDDIFKEARSNYRKTLEGLLTETRFKSATSRNRGKFDEKAGPESDIHYLMKIFVLKILVQDLEKKGRSLKNREEIRDVVKTEPRDELGPEMIPDLMVDTVGRNEVFEVETLFGSSIDPLSEIEERIDEYDDKAGNEIEKVNFVLDNFTMLRHLNELKKDYEQFNKDFDMEFYTLDLKNEELVPLQNIGDRVSEIAQKETDEDKMDSLELARKRFRNND